MFATAAVLMCFDLILLYFRNDLALLWINARGGCYPWSPREVEYHDHMTLCPGQTARMHIPIPKELLNAAGTGKI